MVTATVVKREAELLGKWWGKCRRRKKGHAP